MSLPLDQIIHGDCFKVELPEAFADLMVIDEPYNIATKGKLTTVRGKPVKTTNAWGGAFNDSMTDEEYGEMMVKLAELTDRSLKPEGSVIIFYDRSRPYHLKPFYDRFTFRNMIAFVKKNPGPHYRKNNYRSGYEEAAWFSRDKYYLKFKSQREMINVFYGIGGSIGAKTLQPQHLAKQTQHPTEKYEWMIFPLVERHSRPGDVVFDPMSGSGTSLAVAKKLRRHFVGIELEEKWVETTRRRLNLIPEALV